MAKLDWTKADQANSDPARVSKSDSEFHTFPPTSAGRRDFEQARKARSAAAKRAAQTRKINKEHAEQAERQSQIDALGRSERDKAFFARVQENLNAQRERRDGKANTKPSLTGSLGAMLQEALNQVSKK